MQRCYWHTSTAASSEQDNEVATVDRPDPAKETAQLVNCKLIMGSCQLSTVMHVVKSVGSTKSSHSLDWHIHVGSNDFEALQRNAWDADICYLAARPDLSEMHSLHLQEGVLGRVACPYSSAF